jgi:hypothetical protein
MPEFNVKEVRLPELHLPEIKRDEIVRALSGVHLPEVDLARARRGTFRVPAVSLTGADIDRLLAAGAALTRFVQPAPKGLRAPWRAFGRRSRSPMTMIVRPRTRRSRGPIVLGVLVVIAIGIWAVLRRPTVRQRLDAATQDARERLATWRGQEGRPDDEAVASAIYDAAGQNASENTDDLAVSATDPDGISALEESQTPS